jgi:outer membrane lipoprotein SlyB
MAGGFQRAPIWVGMVVGSVLGGWVPTVVGADAVSFASVVGGTVGGIAGIVLGWMVSKRYF